MPKIRLGSRRIALNPRHPLVNGALLACPLAGTAPENELISGNTLSFVNDNSSARHRWRFDPNLGLATNYDMTYGWTFSTAGFPMLGVTGAPWTMYARVRWDLTTTDTAGQYRYVCSMGDGAAGAPHLARFPADITAKNFVGTFGDAGAGSGYSISNPVAVALHAYDVCGTYDGATTTLYEDGVAVQATSTGGTHTFTGATGTIGCAPRNNAGTSHFNMRGMIQDCWIWDWALAASDVWSLRDPRTQYDRYIIRAAPAIFDLASAGGFNPAWAARSNTLLGGGAWL